MQARVPLFSHDKLPYESHCVRFQLAITMPGECQATARQALTSCCCRLQCLNIRLEAGRRHSCRPGLLHGASLVASQRIPLADQSSDQYCVMDSHGPACASAQPC